MTAGELPDGLSLDAETGAITGTPTTAGPYSFTITATNGVGDDITVVLSGTIVSGEDGFTSVVPKRVLDTRLEGSKVAAGTTYVLPVDETWDVAADASSYVVNVTITEPDALGFVTVFPCGGETPTASTVNYAAGETVANAAVVASGTDDSICIYTLSTTHLVIDLNGYHLSLIHISTPSTTTPWRPAARSSEYAATRRVSISPPTSPSPTCFVSPT